jgi:hypothetical protein
MKRLFVLALLACATVCSLHAQAVDTTVCAVVKNPKSFDGKTVRIKGTVFAGFDSFIIKDTECGYPLDNIWLDYPQGTKGKAGATAVLHIQPAHNYTGSYTAPTRAAVTLDKSKDFKQFDSLLAQAHNKGAGMCLGCMRYEVTATLVGRLDAVADAGIKRDASGKITDFGGFGNMNMYPARLVLQSVSDVAPKELDYTAADTISKGQMGTFSGSPDLYDPLDASAKVAAALAATPAGGQAQKIVTAYGKRGEHTGVVIVNGVTNEAKDEGPAKVDSPDGVLYTCTFNLDRLQGEAYIRAIYHMGEHVVDMRTPSNPAEVAPPFVLEYNAWTMAISSAVVSGQKFLTLPGGFMVWDSAWTPEERQTKMDAGVTGYLNKSVAVNR